MKFVTLLMGAILLAACGSVGHKVSAGITSAQLNGAVGKPYSEVIYQHPDYGKLIGREPLAQGAQIMKHVGEFGSSTSDMAGIYGKRRQNARAIYFLVDAEGKIRDWASEIFETGSAKCWVGLCGGTQSEQASSDEIDKLVKTSGGQPLQAWRGGK